MSWTPLFFLAGYVAFRLASLALIREPAVRKFWDVRVAVGLVAGLVLWKLTPLFTRFEAIWDNPLLLLYMNGGTAALLGGLSMGAGVIAIGLWQIRRETKTRRLTLLAPLGVGVVVVVALWAAQPLWDRLDSASPEAAQWLVPTAQGGKVSLVEARGKVLVLNFWATWCPPCLAELPELQDFQAKHGPGVTLWGVDLIGTEAGGIAKVKSFLEAHKVGWKTLIDDGGELQRAFGVTVVPTTLVFDAKGQLVERRIGAVDLAWLMGLESRYGH